jgi:hypothetical protein
MPDRPRSKIPKPEGPKKAKAQKMPKQGKNFSAPEAVGVASSVKFRNRNPEIQFKVDGSSCRVRHTERIGTLNGSVAFTSTAYAVNPGLPSTFPYLSAIANRFESYRFESLVFMFKTKTATSAVGDVIQVLDYDASDAAPETSIQAESYQGAVSSAPWQDNQCVSSKQNLHKLATRYVRGEAIPANTDVKLYDVANYFVCTENQASTALVGYLYVSYDIILMTPQLRASDFGTAGGVVNGATAMTAANPFGTAPVVDASGRGLSMSAASVLTVSIPGTYNMVIQYTGTVITGINYAAGAGASVTALTSETSNAAGTIRIVNFQFVSTVPNTTLTISATATTITAAFLSVGSAPANSLALAFGQATLGCVTHAPLLPHLPPATRARLFSMCVECTRSQ